MSRAACKVVIDQGVAAIATATAECVKNGEIQDRAKIDGLIALDQAYLDASLILLGAPSDHPIFTGFLVALNNFRRECISFRSQEIPPV